MRFSNTTLLAPVCWKFPRVHLQGVERVHWGGEPLTSSANLYVFYWQISMFLASFCSKMLVSNTQWSWIKLWKFWLNTPVILSLSTWVYCLKYSNDVCAYIILSVFEFQSYRTRSLKQTKSKLSTMKTNARWRLYFIASWLLSFLLSKSTLEISYLLSLSCPC